MNSKNKIEPVLRVKKIETIVKDIAYEDGVYIDRIDEEEVEFLDGKKQRQYRIIAWHGDKRRTYIYLPRRKEIIETSRGAAKQRIYNYESYRIVGSLDPLVKKVIGVCADYYKRRTQKQQNQQQLFSDNGI